jgi:signal transduction histidine kinase/FixJ family two-component response regulator
MQTNIIRKFFWAARGKVIIGFLFAFFALLLAWGISKFAFKKMLNTVEQISAPNDRLRLVNQLSHHISRLDQLQRDQAISSQARNKDFVEESKKLKRSLASLSALYVDDTLQSQRIKRIKKLLADRDKQFMMYLKVRETLVNTKSFSKEVNKLNDLIVQQNQKSDSAVTTETSTSTTTIASDDEKKSRGFLSKLFGKKKAEVYQIISEEFKIKRDTLNKLAQDSVYRNIENTLKSIENEQKEKANKFLKREAVLANASTLITKQMLDILREVEAEAVAQVDANSLQAKAVVNKGIGQITGILVAFFLLTIILLYLILTDISSINRYRKALEAAKDEADYHNSAKQRFLSNMSHEIRTPLQSILGYAELIARQENPKKKDVDAIYQSAMHLLQIVNEILDYNRIISGEFTLQHTVFDVHKVLNEVVDVMRPLAAQKSIALVTDFDLSGITHVAGDAFRLKQILFNLLGNAVKFTLAGEILLALTHKQKDSEVHFHFTIKDTGIGFDEENAHRIFNEFEQIETKDKYLYNQTGTGLGLAIVKSLVENQQGRINVKSKKDVGTTFTVHLKYGLATAPLTETVATSNTNIKRVGKVWVVDDDRLILDLCGHIFSEYQIPFEIFDNANAILSAATVGVNYVLIDMRLPEMSGIEVFRVLKKKMSKNVKFYAITAQVLPDERADVLSEGFEGIIMKPFQIADILSIFGAADQATTIDLDPRALAQMTMGDQQLLAKILDRFKIDCEADQLLLKAALADQNLADSRLIVHRFAGRIAQMGAKQLAEEFRVMELEIAGKSSLDDALKAEVESLMQKIDQLLLLIDEVDYSMP